MIVKSKKIENNMVMLDLSVDPVSRVSGCVAKIKIGFEDSILIFNRKPKGVLHLNIKSKSKNSDVCIQQGSAPLSMSFMGMSGTDFDVTVNGEDSSMLDVVFDPTAIVDCEQKGLKSFDLEFTIDISEGEGEKATVLKTIKDKVTVNLLPIAAEPVFIKQFESLTYKADKVPIEIRVKNNRIQHFAPVLGVKIVDAYVQNPQGTATYKGMVEIDPAGATTTMNYFPDTFLYLRDRAVMTEQRVVSALFPEPGFGVIIPMKLDLSKLMNPQEDSDRYNLVIQYEYWDGTQRDSSKTETAKISFEVKKNFERVSMCVDLQQQQPSGFVTLKEIEGRFRVEEPIVLNVQAVCNYRISVRNTASVIQQEHPNAAVVIRNFSTNGMTLPDGITARGSNDEAVAMDRICACLPMQKEEIRLKSAESINIDVPIDAYDAQVKYFADTNSNKLFLVDAEVGLTFDYYIDHTGNDTPTPEEIKHFEGGVVFQLELEPRREWLGVDFGTSSVVALYGNATDLVEGRDQKFIRNLEEIKRKGLNVAFQKASKEFRNVTDEKVFINSKIVLGNDFANGNKQVESFKDYPEGAILFSPGDQFDYNKLLPSLKSMMGYEKVPRRRGQDDIMVDEVYELAYRQLFNLYLKQLSGNDPIEKIVMTYPNTFATKHVEQLRNLAKECLPTLRDNYIVTLSESDAVAYRYLMRRTKVALLKHYVAKDLDRNVLIYDMGAGTLDLTYLNKVVEDGKCKIDIKGKFGISKAGNYLDYVLAQIVVDICNIHGFHDVNNQSFDNYLSLDANRTGDIETFFKLKSYVKDKLKPILAELESIHYVSPSRMMPDWEMIDGEERLSQVPLLEVLKNNKFVEFIDDVSTKVINGCNKLFGGLKDVDVVVFSGRMSSMKMIREAVKEALGTITNMKYVIDVDIAEGYKEELDYSPLLVRKTAVIVGALNFVENFIGNDDFVLLPRRPFYAHYCAIMQTFDGYVVFDKVDNTMAAQNYSQSKQINLSGVTAIYLIQTYAVDDQDIINDFMGNRNLTTVLGSRDTSNFRNSHDVTVKVDYEEANRFDDGAQYVSLWIDAAKQQMLPHENITSDAFRKSAWPIVF